jgi:GMP synthase-like glutamine amidotransferase
MRIHHLQHVPFEGLGSIEAHLLERGDRLSATHLYRNESLPDVDSFDALIVMGGPMGVMDVQEYPWLTAEKQLIAAAIAAGKKVLGICLGAQLIATTLGAKIYRNRDREIGWWPVTRTLVTTSNPESKLLSEGCVPFHWHGDTFDLPDGAVQLASSAACEQQAFALGRQVIGLQFHLETTPDAARALIKHGGDELDGSRYVQSAEQMLADSSLFTSSNRLMANLLDLWLSSPAD